MASYLLSLLTPAGIDAANTTDRDVLGLLQDMTRRFARKAGEDIDPEDVAAVAALLAPSLLKDGHGASEAASVAVNRAIVAARRDLKAKGDAASIDGATTADGTVLLRLVTPASPDPASRYATTNTDRYRDALQHLDPADRITAHALLSAEWKGGKVPAAAVRRAHGLPPVTGRAGTAWTATVTEDAARLLPALQDAYRAVLVEHGQGTEGWEPVRTYGLPRTRRRTDRAALVADRTAKAPNTERRTPKGGLPRIATEAAPMVADVPATSGPATAAVSWDRRAADRLGTLDGSARRRATEQDRRDVLAVAASLPLTLPAVPAGKAGKAERALCDFDPAGMTPDAAGSARPVAGVAAGMTYGQGILPAGDGSAPVKAKPGKSRVGNTGATVPAGPRR